MIELNLIKIEGGLQADKYIEGIPSHLKRMARGAMRNLKHYTTSQTYTFDRVVEDYFSEKIGSGSVVTIEGLISKYVVTPRPFFDVKIARNVARTLEQYTRFNNTHTFEYKLDATQGQYPIQALPPIITPTGIVYLYFLYPPDTKSFLLPSIEIAKLDSETPKEENIPRTMKPLVLISDKEIDGLHRQIKLTGTINKINESVVELLSGSLASATLKVLENTLRPYAQDLSSLCVDLRDGYTSSVLSSAIEIPAILYTESHFESANSPLLNTKQITNEAAINAESIHWVDLGFGDDISWASAKIPSTVASYKFERFTQYIPTALSNQTIYPQSLRDLISGNEIFRKNMQQSAKKFDLVIKHKYDFTFDYKSAKLFHPEGVMNSKLSRLVCEERPSAKEDIQWLESNSK